MDKLNNSVVKKKNRLINIKILIKKNMISKALVELEDYLYDYPNDSYGLLQYATALIALNKYTDSKKILNDLVDNDTECKYSALYKLGKLAVIEKDEEKALEYFKRNVLESPYNEVFSIIELIKIMKSRGRFSDALSLLESKLDLNDDNLKLEYAKVKLHFNKINEARNISKTIKSFKKNDNLYREVNILKAKIEKSDLNYLDAEKYLKLALQGNKNIIYWKAYLELASLYSECGKIDEANLICKNIIKNNSNYSGKALLVLGDCYFKRHKFDDARNMYEKAITKDKYCKSEYHSRLGELEMCLKNYDEAKRHYNSTRNKTGDLSNTVKFKLMLTLLKKKEYEEAYKMLDIIDKDDLNKFQIVNYERSKLYLEAKTVRQVNKCNLTYSEKQIVSYSFDDALTHIDRDHVKEATAKFNDDIDLEALLISVPELLKDSVIVDNYFFETYQVDYPNIGTVNDENVSKLAIVTLPNSTKVLTMFPIKEEFVEHHKKEQSFVKKRKSQIEKFNERYGIK